MADSPDSSEFLFPSLPRDATEVQDIVGLDESPREDIFSPSCDRLPITLQVGERRFITTHNTMTSQSTFFFELLSSPSNSQQVDGSYFIDADPDVFVHILRYLRRGVLPIFYDKVKGHDYAQYLALLKEARYFRITRLEKWLSDKRYLEAIKVMHEIDELDGASRISEIKGADVEVDYRPMRITKQVYICPQNIFVHQGNPSACGRRCRSIQGDAPDKYITEEYWKTIAIRKRPILNEEICVDSDLD
ncbi:MAG: hypothetical protein M1834_004225 [Cirrosporium novae-zelandiae]|nr:MAG: hypothetical protein M1834_004225 [Cirrosporium novae-zelandiae]